MPFDRLAQDLVLGVALNNLGRDVKVWPVGLRRVTAACWISGLRRACSWRSSARPAANAKAGSGITGTREWIAVKTSTALPFGSRQCATSFTAATLHGDPSMASRILSGCVASPASARRSSSNGTGSAGGCVTPRTETNTKMARSTTVKTPMAKSVAGAMAHRPPRNATLMYVANVRIDGTHTAANKPSSREPPNQRKTDNAKAIPAAPSAR
jgi:hypothetical protein